MHARLGEPLTKCTSFVTETFTTITKALTDVAYEDALDEESASATNALVEMVVEEVVERNKRLSN